MHRMEQTYILARRWSVRKRRKMGSVRKYNYVATNTGESDEEKKTCNPNETKAGNEKKIKTDK